MCLGGAPFFNGRNWQKLATNGNIMLNYLLKKMLFDKKSVNWKCLPKETSLTTYEKSKIITTNKQKQRLQVE